MMLMLMVIEARRTGCAMARSWGCGAGESAGGGVVGEYDAVAGGAQDDLQ